MPQSIRFTWPEYLDKHKIPENAFAEAYTVLSDIERSRIKQNIAQLYSMAPFAGYTETSISRQWAAGFHSRIHIRPKDWVLILLSGTYSGPASLVSAVIPALTSGVSSVLAVFLAQAAWMPRLLVSLELCGLESVCVLGKRQLRTLLSHLLPMPTRGVVLDPDGMLADMSMPGNWPGDTTLWQAPRHDTIGIWYEAGTRWDVQALAWNHPGLRIEIWGNGPQKLPPGCNRMSGGWEDFCRNDFQAVGLPKNHLIKHPRLRCNLVLTPGQENCWLWPDMSPDLFRTRQAALVSIESLPRNGFQETKP